MSDRHMGYIVVLEKDLKDEDSERVISAIGCIAGVVKVEPIVGNVEKHFAITKAKQEIWDKLFDVFKKDIV